MGAHCQARHDGHLYTGHEHAGLRPRVSAALEGRALPRRDSSSGQRGANERGTPPGEADDVGEEHRDALVLLRHHRLAALEPLRDVLREHLPPRR